MQRLTDIADLRVHLGIDQCRETLSFDAYAERRPPRYYSRQRMSGHRRCLYSLMRVDSCPLGEMCSLAMLQVLCRH